MLITRTPFRVSFFGGGTDYYEYFSEFGGSVLSTTIDKYCYLTIRKLPPFFEHRNQLTYSKIERFNETDEIQHPLVRAALEYMPTDRIQISYDSDLPACPLGYGGERLGSTESTERATVERLGGQVHQEGRIRPLRQLGFDERRRTDVCYVRYADARIPSQRARRAHHHSDERLQKSE